KPIQVKELELALERLARPSRVASLLSDLPVPPLADLDLVVLNELRSLQIAGEPDLLQSLIELFVAETPSLLVQMRDAAAQGDGDGLRRAAHSLKSSSGSLGACQMAALCAQLEKLGRSGITEGTVEKVRQLEQAFERVCEALVQI